MRIIHILSGKANPNTLNGVNKVVDALATEQTLLGHEITVCAVASNKIQRHQPAYNYILFQEEKNKFKPSKYLKTYLSTINDKTTFIHFHSVFIPWFLPLIKWLKRKGFKNIVLTPHSGYATALIDQALKKKLFFRFYDSRILKAVKTVHIIGKNIELNHYTRPYIQQYAILPNGCYYQESTETKIISSPFIFGYMGRLKNDQKGLDLLIQAFYKYKKEGGTGVLRLAGSGPDEKKIKKMILTYKLEDSVQLAGVVFNENKIDFLNRCSAFIHTSRWDVFPTGCLEAANQSVPLLITKETDLDSYVGKYNSGIIISPNTIENICSCLKKFEHLFLNEQPVYLQMCHNAQQMIKQELNWHTIAQKSIQELYV